MRSGLSLENIQGTNNALGTLHQTLARKSLELAGQYYHGTTNALGAWPDTKAATSAQTTTNTSTAKECNLELVPTQAAAVCIDKKTVKQKNGCVTVGAGHHA